ncbi:DUF4404 family protein [Pseudomonas sp. N040]|uniref:DUF4404 family protein n=1 Tax=Pseudomonas sp. N040 TaxID=2785325 RepID=UPI0018A26C81|nr:DUF4404 family protein [Pseudomonas sp. N040]MBF7730814.1 DUF4404 family protein [Pseudomonas sp. N040]MBW7014457.1 DUF4404 family protein [Pseudomonas sp. N040]
MPQNLQQQLQQLRDQLANNPPLDADERASLVALLQEIEANLVETAETEQNESLVDGVNLAIERFEVSHPTLTATLRNILQSLANMGI